MSFGILVSAIAREVLWEKVFAPTGGDEQQRDRAAVSCKSSNGINPRREALREGFRLWQSEGSLV